jgi:hypothetical protein
VNLESLSPHQGRYDRPQATFEQVELSIPAGSAPDYTLVENEIGIFGK